MSASAHSNEHYEILLRNVSLALGDAVLQLIKNHKKVSGGNILSQLVTEIERAGSAAVCRAAFGHRAGGVGAKRLSARYKRRQGLRPP